MLNNTIKSSDDGSVLIMMLFVLIIIMLISTGILYLIFRDILSAENLVNIISNYYLN